MGCGASQDPSKEASTEEASKETTVTETPVEEFDGGSADINDPITSTSRKTRDDTIAQNKRDAHDADSSYDSASSGPVPNFANSPGTVPRKGPVLEEPPNPFAVNRRDADPVISSPAVDARGAGYKKEKDTKKRGAFDPERYRAANGRGGADNTLNADGSLHEYSAHTFNNQGANQAATNQGGSNWNEYGSRSPVGGQQNSRYQNQPNLGIGHEGDSGSRQTGQWQKDYIPASDFNNKPKEMFREEGGAAGGFGAPPPQQQRNGFGAQAGWDADPRGAPMQPDQALNRTDEQELDDILSEIGDIE